MWDALTMTHDTLKTRTVMLQAIIKEEKIRRNTIMHANTPRDEEGVPVTIRLSREDYAYITTSENLTDDAWLDAVMALAVLTLRDHVDWCREWMNAHPRLAGTSAFPDDPLLDCVLSLRPGMHRERSHALHAKCLAGRRWFNTVKRSP